MHAGIIFILDGSSARIRVSKRVDLSRSRMEQQVARRQDLDRAKRLAQRRGETIDRSVTVDVLGVVETPSMDSARKLRRVLLQVFAGPGSGDLVATAKVPDALARCRRFGKGLAVYEPNSPAPARRAIFNGPSVDRRYVPDPLMTRSTFIEESAKFPDARWVGWIKADVSMQVLIGGLARVRGKTEAQVQAAAEYRNLAERALIGGAKAIDYSKTRVDTSGPSENYEIEGTEEARRKYLAAVERLGGPESHRCLVVEKMIVHGMSVSAVALELLHGEGGAAREKVTAEVLAATDELAKEFGYAADPARNAKPTAWSDGSQQTFTADGETAVIATRRAM
ncbi:MAG: hypothetical protein JWQ89_2270 [Devosia sp.]|uniref:hypothetical protein n=1 Tax=Devosia sp. TaxID=1871048 RepID=UPI002609BB01|nr:hypothetical protein [Devosia sp.]MDB5540543.1 hypothetical protein [Devosia sp.]